MSIKIFSMTHKKFEIPEDNMYVPLHVGHQMAKEKWGYVGDDTGDNISHLNGYYAELSGVYWVWKNVHDIDYVGICHYRRYLISEEGHAFTSKQYEQILQHYDIMTTKQLELPNSYYYGFGAHHKIEALDKTGEIIKEKYPDYYDTYINLVHQNKTYFANMLVAKKELFDEYAEWLFTILFTLQEQIDLTFEDDYHKRIFGFVSEFLLYVWVTVKKLKAYECRVAVIGEKMETREIKEKIALYFKEKDYLGAKQYFEQCLKIRPDILMEASDVTGECKLCLQAVSTANLEMQTYGACFLQKRNEYDDIMQYFKNLNQYVLHENTECLTKEDKEWFENTEISTIAYEAAKRILITPIRKTTV